MAEKNNTIWWVVGVIVVLVVLVGGGILIFNTERSQCLRDGGEWVDDNILSNMNERINLLEESNKVIARELSRISEIRESNKELS